MVTFNISDLQFILEQIQMAEAGQPPVNPHLAFGLREVAGTDNNSVPNQGTFGSADQPFTRVGTPVFLAADAGTSYAQTAVDPNAIQNPGDPNFDPVAAGWVIDTAPRQISNLISDQSINNQAAVQSAIDFAAQLGDGYGVLPTTPSGIFTFDANGNPVLPADTQNLFIGNITPDAGLSAPFNTWMTLFGQFFDHGLDLVNKGGSGVVVIPLAPDDPLLTVGPDGDPNTPDQVDPSQAFMVLTRATNLAGADGVVGTADDVHDNTNATTPFVDQNQTYTSHPAHQAFLRDYVVGVDNKIHATGKLLEGRSAGGDGQFMTGDDVLNGGMATWAVVKAAAAVNLGVLLDDRDVGSVPLLVTDDYGNLKLDAAGRVQIVVDVAETINNVTTITQHIVKATPGGIPVDIHALTLAQTDFGAANPNAAYTVTVVSTGHAFLNDIAHTAAPVVDANGNLLADGDTVAGNAVPVGPDGHNLVYDNELLDAHYIAGDGRANENIGLTAVHEIFHSEHNRLLEQTKALIQSELDNGNVSFAQNWVLANVNLTPVAGVPHQITDAEWNGERLFQVAKFGTETQYQHLVFEEFARRISPTIHLFGNNDITLDPAITAEFAHAIYRFGHSMLDESVPRYQMHGTLLPDGSPDPLAGTPVLDANGQPVLDDIGLIAAFLNPLEYANHGATAAGEIVLGTTSQIGNEIDEFVTGALRNNLLGLPLDLATLNIARGRDTGVPTLNLLRNELFERTHDTTLKAYASWSEFGQFLKHAASLVNFVAAYGQHDGISNAADLATKRLNAANLVTLGLDEANKDAAAGSAERDAYDFMHSLGVYANDVNSALAVHDAQGNVPVWSTGSVTGLDRIDLWIGGLAEKLNLNGGLLGSTFNFIFETQLEALQDGDRLYYLPRLEGLHFAGEIEGNTFADLIMRNTGTHHLSANIFGTPEYVVEAGTVTDDITTWLRNPVSGALIVEKLSDADVHSLVDNLSGLAFGTGFDTQVHFIGDDNFLGNTMVLGGTEGRDVLIAGQADDDTVWGDGGDDYIDGGNGDDNLFGGTGNDTVRDSAGADIIHGEEGNDDLDGGIGDDIIFGGDGDDLINGGMGIDEVLGGLGNDIILGGEDDDEMQGNEGDDWMEGGDGGDILVGDQGAPTGQVPLIEGNDVLDGGATGDKMQGFSGDDIMLGLGGFDKFLGGLGFDWGSFEKETHGVDVDMTRRDFIPDPLAPAGDAIRDVWTQTEGFSGSQFDDVVKGENTARVDPFNELTNTSLIFGVTDFFETIQGAPPVAFSGGDILLGAGGSDRIMGGGGNDIIDGDAYLHVELLRGYTTGSPILREIRYDTALPTDIDTAVFNDILQNYSITLATSAVDIDGNGLLDDIRLAADGTPIVQVSHLVNGVTPGADGTDLLFHIERLQFADTTIDGNPFSPNFLLPFVSGAPTITPDADVTTPVVEIAAGTTALIDVSNIFDINGIDPNQPFTVQWQMDDGLHIGFTNIAGATYTIDQGGVDTTGFLITDFQVGKTLRAMVSFTDGTGIREFTLTAPTAIVTADPNINHAPTIQLQSSPAGLPDTSAKANLEMNVPLPLLSVFTDDTTPANLLQYTATLADGSTLESIGLHFGTTLDPAGATGAEILNGVITGVPPINFTGPIDIRITATDPGGLSVTDTFRINVLPNSANTPPVITSGGGGTSAAVSVGENTTLVTTVTAIDAQDPNGITYSLVGGADRPLFAIDPQTGALSFLSAPDFENPADVGSNNVYNVIVRASDPQGKFDQQAIAITVTNADEAGAGGISIAGHSRAGVAANQVVLSAASTLTDPDLPGGVVPQFSWQNAANTVLGTAQTLTVTAGAAVQTIHLSASYVDPFGVKTVPDAPQTAIIGTTAASNLSGTNGRDFLIGFGGADTLAGGAGDDVMDGGAGTDTVTFAATAGPVVVDLGAGTASGEGSDTLLNIENVTGSAFGDTLSGSAAANVLNGGDGDDTLQGRGGNDTITGGAGSDTAVFANAASQQAFTLNANGTITITGQPVTPQSTPLEGTDTLSGIETLRFAGTDLILVQGTNQAGTETINGTATNEIILGFDGNDVLNGNDGNDVIYGGLGTDTIDGGAGDDTIVYTAGGGNNNPASGRDIIDGGANATAAGDRYVLNGDATGETFHVYSRDAWLALGGGNHTLVNAQTQIVITRGGTNNANVISELRNIEEITINTGNGNDNVQTHGTFGPTTLNQNTITIVDGGGNDTVDITDQTSTHRVVFQAGDGADVFVGPIRNQDIIAADGTVTRVQNGTSGNDVMAGSAGDDELHGSDGDDLLEGGSGQNKLYGEGGNDRIRAGAGDDIADGGTGRDTYVASTATTTVTVNLQTGHASGQETGQDLLYRIENAATGSGDDLVIGTGQVNYLDSGAGDDVVYGMGGDDMLISGAGNDKVYAGAGNDVLDAGGGNDWFHGGEGSDSYHAGQSQHAVTVNLAKGVAYGVDVGHDQLYSIERVVTGSGDDTILGNGEANVVRAGAGNDTIDGRGGNDRVYAGAGDDTVNTQFGNDVIVFEKGFGNDRIVHFDADARGGQDHLDISALGIAAENFSAHVTITESGADLLVTIDGTDSIRLVGAQHSGPLTLDDFILSA